MPALTDLVNVKSIARGDARIQALAADDVLVTNVLTQVAIDVQAAVFGVYTEVAQRYLAAHYLSQALQDAAGRGALSSEAVGSVSQSWGMPYLPQKSVLGSTQYGMQFLQFRNMVLPAIALVQPSV